MDAAQQHTCILLQVASHIQDAAVAEKGLALIAAASHQVASFPEGRKAGLSDSVRSMVHSLEMTMIQHPLLSLRNMAFWALDSLLDALQVEPATRVVQQLLDSDSPGVAALMLHRLQQQAAKCWGQISGAEWNLLQPLLLSSALAWLDPHGSHGWALPNSIMSNIEAICSALNLCRFLLLREQATGSNLTEVSSPSNTMQLKSYVSLLTAAVHSARIEIDQSQAPDIEMVLAVSRCLEVLSRVSQLLDTSLQC